MKKPLSFALAITLIGAILLILLDALQANVGALASLVIIVSAPMWPVLMIIEQLLPFPLPANVVFYVLGAIVSIPYYFGLFYLFFYNKKSARHQIVFKSFAITIFASVTLFNIGLQFMLLTANFGGN
jgi:hypothetical protein